jgi:hypothetical protein
LLPKLLAKPYVWADHRQTFSVVVPLFLSANLAKKQSFGQSQDV